jgi:RNA polymerase sigma-32 factor
MGRDKEIVPPPAGDEKGEGVSLKKKSFVRVAKSSREKVRKPVVLEPEVLDDDEDTDEDELSDSDGDEGDVIDVGEYLDTEGDSSDERRPSVVVEEAPFEEEESGESYEIPEEKGLVVSTGLQRYLAEIRRYSLLTPAEEKELAFRAYEQGDTEARNKLVTSNLRLVVKIAMEYRRAYSQILDLIQEGNAGLVQAVNRFNPYRNVKLSTYSAWWIRAYILKFLMDNKSLVRMGTTDAQRKLFFRLRSEAEKMYALTQRFDARLLAENIGVKEQDVVEMQQRLSKNDVSLDTPLGEDGDSRQVDTLSSNFDDPDHALERAQLLKILRAGLGEVEKELNERDLFIYQNRILADDPITLQDVGDRFGITRERARQLEARVLKRIKEKVLDHGLLR